jgi:hypothetical protein
MNLTMFHGGMIAGPAIAGVFIAAAGTGTRASRRSTWSMRSRSSAFW